MKCFIASAFGKPDVDQIYSNFVRSLLLKKSITPLRVDHITHNDDIDKKILSLIEECDFSIADLTYARPSVYYEAGRVHGLGKPVIFTVRSDHFVAREDDPAGNLRVHFDLQMKNIISWGKGLNPKFRAKLSSRIDLVINPLLRKSGELGAEKVRRDQFDALSVKDKLRHLSDVVRHAVRKQGFAIPPVYGDKVNFISYKETSSQNYWVLAALVEHTFNGRLISGMEYIPHSHWFNLHELPDKISPVVRKDIFVVTLRKIDKRTLEKSLHNYSPVQGDDIYWRESGYVKKMETTVFHFITPAHPQQLALLMAGHLERMSHKKQFEPTAPARS